MKKHLIAALMTVAIAAPVALPTAATAQRHDRNGRNDHWDAADHYKSGGNYKERRLGRDDRVYRGRDGRNYCKRSDGTTGLVIGAVGGGLLGNLVGGGTLGTLAGAGGGALLGRSVDRGNVKCR